MDLADKIRDQTENFGDSAASVGSFSSTLSNFKLIFQGKVIYANMLRFSD